jgi:glycosyltransferase involved in cell wall biosynthesis
VTPLPAPTLDLSIVVPVFNEAESLAVLWPELREMLDAQAWRAEVIFVDDGSTDASAEVVRGLVAQDRRVRLLRLRENAGLTAALHAGLTRARGQIVVTMDGDLQNDPGDIPALIAHLGAWDAATGWRRQRPDPWLKRVSSRIANAVRNRVTGEDVRDSASTMRALRRSCAVAIPPYRGMHRFVPTLLRMAGFRVLEVPIHHRPRRFGVSHFGVRNRAWTAFQDLLAVRWMQSRILRYEIEESS